MIGLTRRQSDLLQFIKAHIAEFGIPPSYDEMKDALDLSSKSGIYRLLTALEERGYIHRKPSRARCIEVLDPDARRNFRYLPPSHLEYLILFASANGKTPEEVVADAVREWAIRDSSKRAA